MESMQPPADARRGPSDATPGVRGSIGLVALFGVGLLAVSHPVLAVAAVAGAVSTLLVQRGRSWLSGIDRERQDREPRHPQPSPAGRRGCTCCP